VSNAPSITVVIPSYNCARWIGDAIGSVLGQSVQPSQIVIVDDGSSDDTEERVSLFDSPLIQYVRQANQGVSAARNNGLARASGDLIAFLDADDAWHPRKLEIQVLALRRRPELFDRDPLVDESFAPAKLDQMLAASDYVLLAAPLTEETRGMVGAPQIAAMKSTAVLINVGRGAVVDEPALIQALEAGKIRGAALDVFAVEPLRAAHPFYKMENVLLSPHTADHVRDFIHLAVECFLENLRRFRANEPLLNLVDKHAGY